MCVCVCVCVKICILYVCEDGRDDECEVVYGGVWGWVGKWYACEVVYGGVWGWVCMKICIIVWKWSTFTVRYQTHCQKVALHFVYRSDSVSFQI